MSFEVDIEKRLADRVIATRFAAETGVTALFGPSGAGKTTILSMIAGLITPDRGYIAVNGEVLFDSRTGFDSAPERRRLGYIFQDGRLFPHRKVRANLLYGYDLCAPAERWITPEEVIDFLGIAELLDRWPKSLSGGEAQRVAIGRALLSSPRFLLMDEPLSSLDQPRREEILAVIERIAADLRLPILYVTHDRQEIERLNATIVAIG